MSLTTTLLLATPTARPTWTRWGGLLALSVALHALFGLAMSPLAAGWIGKDKTPTVLSAKVIQASGEVAQLVTQQTTAPDQTPAPTAGAQAIDPAKLTAKPKPAASAPKPKEEKPKDEPKPEPKQPIKEPVKETPKEQPKEPPRDAPKEPAKDQPKTEDPKPAEPAVAKAPAEPSKPTLNLRAQPPAKAVIGYTMKVKAGMLTPVYDSTLVWEPKGNSYTLSNKSPQFSFSSTGALSSAGLEPTLFVDQRGKRTTNTHIVRERGEITFSSKEGSVPITGAPHDLFSAIMQLTSIARADSQPLRSGVGIQIQVATRSSAHVRTFRALREEEITTDLGPMQTLYITSIRREDVERDTNLEIWLAPGQDWLPVRVRLTAGDNIIDQVITSIQR